MPARGGSVTRSKARWAGITAERRELRDRLEGAKAALAWSEHAPAPGEHFSPVLEDRARRFLAGRKPNAVLLRHQVVALEDEVNQAATRYSIEAAAWRVAVADEAKRRADALRPRHQAAVRRIAKAVEELSAAVEAERGVRSALADVGGTGLPDAGREFGTLNEYNSLLSAWNRRLLAEGLL